MRKLKYHSVKKEDDCHTSSDGGVSLLPQRKFTARILISEFHYYHDTNAYNKTTVRYKLQITALHLYPNVRFLSAPGNGHTRVSKKINARVRVCLLRGNTLVFRQCIGKRFLYTGGGMAIQSGCSKSPLQVYSRHLI